MRERRTPIIAIVGMALLALAIFMQTAAAPSDLPVEVSGSATTVKLGASKDNTLYEHSAGELSNGAGQYFFAGRTGDTAEQKIRRGLIAFDVAGDLPAGAIVLSATLTLNLSKAPFGSFGISETLSLHKVTTGWGEGASDALFDEGAGIMAENGDATWLHAVYSATSPADSVSWTTPGGDFAAEASAVASVGWLYEDNYSWGPTHQMTTDVRSWLYAPEDNHGWLLLGNEAETFTARRFDSRENPTPDNRPFLSVTYVVPSSWSYLPLITR